MIKRNNVANIIIAITLALFFWTFTCMNMPLFKVYTDKEHFMLSYFITALVSCGVICFLGVTKIKMNKPVSVITGSLSFVAAIFGAMQISILFVGGFNGRAYVYFVNILFYLAFAMLSLVLSGSTRVGAITAVAVSYAFSMSSCIVEILRGTALMPTDIFAWGTAMNVASEYKFKLDYRMITSTIFACALIMLAFKFPLKFKFKLRHLVLRTAGAAVLAGVVAFIITTDFSSMDISQYNQSTANLSHGTALSFYVNLSKMGLSQRADYDPAKLDEKLLSFKTDSKPSEKEQKITDPTNPYKNEKPIKSTLNENGVKPNIIVIMNESFADLKSVGDFKTNKDYMPFYRSLKTNTIKGELLVSPFGGYTCNTEYEFLTGMNIGTLSVHAAPYLQMMFDNLPYSLPIHMRELGYKATAIHPFQRDGWNRNTVYSYLGFDEFISIENFDKYSEYPDRLREYVSDKGDYSAIINMLWSKDPDEREFVFNITMQNHGGYNHENFKSEIFLEGMKGDYPETEQYLTLISESDEALKYLINTVKGIKEPTLIVMFGDHMPNVEQGFYEELYGKPLSQLTNEERMRQYRVPFMLWANYDIKEQEGLKTSPSFLSSLIMETAKLPKSRVQMYLDGLHKEVQQMNQIGYYDPDGHLHKNSELPKIKEYHNLQYALLKGERLHYDFNIEKDTYIMFGSNVISPHFVFGDEYDRIKSYNP